MTAVLKAQIGWIPLSVEAPPPTVHYVGADAAGHRDFGDQSSQLVAFGEHRSFKVWAVPPPGVDASLAIVPA